MEECWEGRMGEEEARNQSGGGSAGCSEGKQGVVRLSRVW